MVSVRLSLLLKPNLETVLFIRDIALCYKSLCVDAGLLKERKGTQISKGLTPLRIASGSNMKSLNIDTRRKYMRKSAVEMYSKAMSF